MKDDSIRLIQENNHMKRYFLLGLAALGLIALVPTKSKADDGFRVYVSPGYQPDGPYYYRDDRYRYYRHADEYRWQRGTGTIIGTITIEIMIGTATGIDASCFFFCRS